MRVFSKWVYAISAIAALLLFLFIGIIIGYYAIAQIHENELSADEVRSLLFGQIKEENIRTFLKDLTNQSHPSGTKENDEVGQYIFNAFNEFGLSSVKFANYDVLLSRPNETDANTVQILNSNGSVHLTLANRETVPESTKYFESAYFAYSPKGTAESNRIFYVNQATEQDFDDLEKFDINIDFNGSIILTRYGGGFRGDKLAKAHKLGVKAVLFFLDPSLVAPYGIEESAVLPNDQWMPGSAMERGSVFTGDGDPLSQEFVSEPLQRTSYRQTVEEANFPSIPAVPIGYADAQRLFNIMAPLTVLSTLPKKWRPSNHMNYSFGGVLSEGRKIRLKVTNYPEITRIRNVIGTIVGREEPDRYVLLGNHYDAWTFGSIDPNSGTAVMLEIARIMGNLLQKGKWRPRRTIVFGAWDAEEYGLIGSTEWVEENLQILHSRAVAYINCDAAVRGRLTFVSASMPLLADVIFSATKMVSNPRSAASSLPPLSVYDVWSQDSQGVPQIGRLSASSDYASFVGMVGVPSADIRYVGPYPNPAYHTAFETFEYVDKFIDPGFVYHAVMTKVWTEIVRDLADSAFLPFSVSKLALDIATSWEIVKKDILEAELNFTTEINIDMISDAITEFVAAINVFSAELENKRFAIQTTKLETKELNDRLLGIERMFIDPKGIPGRPLARHILQAPPRSNSYGSLSFPGILDCIVFIKDAIKNQNELEQAHWKKELKEHSVKVAQMIRRAARFLLPV